MPVFLVTLAAPGGAGPAVPARPLQRPGRVASCPPIVPSRVAYDTLVAEFPMGDFAPLVLAVRAPTARSPTPTNVGRLYDYSRRLAADPRVERVESIVDIDPRLGREPVPAAPLEPGRSRATGSSRRRSRRTTDGDLTAFTVITWYGTNDPEARALVHDLRDPASRARAAGGRRGCSWAAAPPRWWTSSTRSRRTSRGPRCSSSSRPTSSCSCCCARWSCRPRRWS